MSNVPQDMIDEFTLWNTSYERFEQEKIAITPMDKDQMHFAAGWKKCQLRAQRNNAEPVARVDDLERGGRVRALALGLGLDTPLYTAIPDAGFVAGMMKAAEICDELEAENKQIGAAHYDAMADGAHNCAHIIREAIPTNSKAALSTEAQSEVTGAVAWLFRDESLGGAWTNWQATNDKGLIESRMSQVDIYKFEATPLYPPSAIEAAVREKLEAAALITPLQAEKLALKVEIERGFEEDITTYENGDVHTTSAGLAAIIIEYIRALMESPHTSVEEPAN